MTDEQLSVLDAALRMMQDPRLNFNEVDMATRNILFTKYEKAIRDNIQAAGRRIVSEAIARIGYFSDALE